MRTHNFYYNKFRTLFITLSFVSLILSSTRFSNDYARSDKKDGHRLCPLAWLSFHLFFCIWYNREQFIYLILEVSDKSNSHKSFTSSYNKVCDSEDCSFHRQLKDCIPRSSHWSSKNMLYKVHILLICPFSDF